MSANDDYWGQFARESWLALSRDNHLHRDTEFTCTCETAPKLIQVLPSNFVYCPDCGREGYLV